MALIVAMVLALAMAAPASAAVSAPGAPRPLSATAADGTVTLTWAASSGEPAGYYVWRRGADGEWTRIATTSGSTLTYVDREVTAESTYTYGLRAFNDQGVSASSNLVTITPGTTPSSALREPGAPRPLVATAGDGVVSLTWGASSDGPAGYYVWRLGADGVWTLLATTSQATLTYVDGGVANGAGYTYGVRAFNDQGVSASSNLVTVAPSVGAAAQPRCGAASSAYQALITKTPGLAAYWRLGDAAGSAACEVTGRNDGGYVGAVTLRAPAGLAGDADTAAGLDGSTGYVRVPHSSSLSLGDSFTLEAWVKRASIGGSGNQVIVSKQTNSWVLMFDPKNRLVLRRSNVADVVTSTAALTDTARWHHVVATKSGASTRLFIDGTDVTGRVTNQTMADNVKPLVIGQSSDTAFFRGAIDEVAVYAGALTPSQVAAHYRSGADPVIAAAGDIACSPANVSFNLGMGTATACRQRQTSDLLVDANLSAVLPLGDGQYETGTLADFLGSYDASWGRLKAITRPVAGNHEYESPGAAGYFDYFNGTGAATGPAGDRDKGYYSYDVGSWHLIALNSECAQIGGCEAGSPQEQWLRSDLAASQARCTLAYWHKPLFNSGEHGNDAAMRPLWQALYDAGAELVLNGHSHSYERFEPQDPAGNVDPSRGIRQLTVGTGGAEHHNLVMIQPNSVALNANTFGVLKLALHPDGYDWQFVPEAGGAFMDSGSSNCH